MTTTTIFTLAEQLSRAFETAERSDGSKFRRLKDGSPDWMWDAIRSAHGDSMPSDTVYGFVERCANALADAGPEFDPRDVISEVEPDVYTSDLTAWLNASNYHVDYLTQAAEEFGITDGFMLLAAAQQIHIREIGDALVSALEAIEPEGSDE